MSYDLVQVSHPEGWPPVDTCRGRSHLRSRISREKSLKQVFQVHVTSGNQRESNDRQQKKKDKYSTAMYNVNTTKTAGLLSITFHYMQVKMASTEKYMQLKPVDTAKPSSEKVHLYFLIELL